MLITLANQKGGTGKTTLATNLAGAFAADHRRVVLVDIDPQRSALEWAETRPEAVPQIPVLSLQGTEDAWRRALAPLREAYEVIILDTGGRISPAVRYAVTVADFLLVPTLASLPDVRSTETFYQQIIQAVARDKAVYGGIVLNAVQGGTLLAKEAEAYLRERGFPVFTARLHQYIAFREAIGRGLTVQEYEPASKAARDLAHVYDELKEYCDGKQKA